MKYISLFTGIGGLEDRDHPPIVYCEMDEACIGVLEKKYPDADIERDVETLTPPEADVVAGGWPCQDLSIAGQQVGLDGSRSRLFFHLLRVAQESNAHTLLAENVPNLLRLDGQRTYLTVLESLSEAGFPFIAWRMLNARAFGLPQQRNRVIIVASKHPEVAWALHRPLPPAQDDWFIEEPSAAGFYWTAGVHSICYSPGYTPAIKVGSSLSIPSPPAVYYNGNVRTIRADEALRLQGFDSEYFRDVKRGDAYRMAGNAVAVPVGQFAFDSLREWGLTASDFPDSSFGFIAENGFYHQGTPWKVEHEAPRLATNLESVIDMTDVTSLSQRASEGLLRRLEKSGKVAPEELTQVLSTLAHAKA
jgi:DNA (cytosine-5)-methyltransferase 1